MQEQYLTIKPLTMKELEEIVTEKQNFLEQSVLSEIIREAITKKIEMMREVPENVQPWLTYWLIEVESSDMGIGLIGCKFLPDEDGYVELGYAIAKEWQGKGYMTEALVQFLDWLYEYPFCKGVLLSIQENNQASIKVAEKCGFMWEYSENFHKIYRYLF